MSDTMTSIWRGAREILRVVAPTLATALGGPLGGQAVQFVTQALGLAPDASAAQVTAALRTATPEQLGALKKQDQDFAVTMRGLDIEIDKLAVADRDSARDRQARVGDRSTFVLAWLTVIAVFAMIFMILTGVADVRGEFQATVVGVALAVFKDVYGFFYGSSVGSKQKGADMAAQAAAR